jgi:hypothetical protein
LTQCPAIPSPIITPTTAGIGAGIIAAIVIGVVVGVVLLGIGGKKGYDYYKARFQITQGAQTNPLYKDPGTSGNNPFYDGNGTEMGAK